MTTKNATAHKRNFVVIGNQLTAFSVTLIRTSKFMNGSLSVAQRNHNDADTFGVATDKM